MRSFGNKMLSLSVNWLFGTHYSDLCYGYNAFWRDILPLLELPRPHVPAAEEMLWGDGFEIETVINVRIARHNLRIAEVPSIERLRIHGESNLNAVGDGLRILRTIIAERSRWKAGQEHAMPVPLPLPDDGSSSVAAQTAS